MTFTLDVFLIGSSQMNENEAIFSVEEIIILTAIGEIIASTTFFECQDIPISFLLNEVNEQLEQVGAKRINKYKLNKILDGLKRDGMIMIEDNGKGKPKTFALNLSLSSDVDHNEMSILHKHFKTLDNKWNYKKEFLSPTKE